MSTTSSVAEQAYTGAAIPPARNFMYKTVAIYPNFSDVGAAVILLKKNGFTEDKISLLGREQEHWQESLKFEWEALHTAKGSLEGAALGSIPGLVLVAGIALTGGAGLLVAGPMAVALTSLGLGAVGGGLMGGVAVNIDGEVDPVDVDKEVIEAIGLGQWVIVAHSYDKAEAMIAQSLLPHGRTVHENNVTDEI